MTDPARAIAALPDATRRLVVAFSGGPDSTALLHALATAGHAVPLHAMHVCHHLEPDAEAWAAHCAHRCASAGIEFGRLDVSVDAGIDGLEAAARASRYAALSERIGPGDVLVCAHHGRDQAETFLLQALRGAGVAGLAAMPVLTRFGSGRLWRPWLSVDRSAIMAYAQAQALDWIEDATNRDPRRARGYLRSRVWPSLADRWPAAAVTLSRSAAWAADAAAAVDTLAAIDLDAARGPDNTLTVAALSELSAARTGEVVRRWLVERGLDCPDHRHVEQIRSMFGARAQAGPRVGFAATEVRCFDGRLFAMPRLAAAPDAMVSIAWSRPDGLALPPDCGRLTIASRVPPAWPADLHVRFRSGGERLTRADGQRVALAECLRAARVPPWVRERLPLIHVGRTLIAVPGYWQHPVLPSWFGGLAPAFAWENELTGAPARLVDR